MRTIALLTVSNIFMTFAWYGHLKYREVPLFKVIVISWMIAFFEYCFQVPANRIGSYDAAPHNSKPFRKSSPCWCSQCFPCFISSSPCGGTMPWGSG